MKTFLLAKFQLSKDYTLQVAHSMPAQHYDYRPSPHLFTFKEQMHHLAYSLLWMEENYLKQNRVPWQVPPPVKADKPSIIAYLTTAFGTLIATVTAVEDDEKLAEQCFAILDHTTYHRAQGILYMRELRLEVPAYMY
ncbi:hypothetical protein LX64_03982 [Chitinophaga skermanii]|uniref:DinB-like domain-containing protein n=1 Tax=Chitinophaga skermanii TaxID=331697 RepID=A0A327Q7D1_9BACT|nr:DinB family protein [Chitinophaga skermanii]RAJ00280.1 hypothetical protein LX64_03982 [Chitinophaga skermanii]